MNQQNQKGDLEDQERLKKKNLKKMKQNIITPLSLKNKNLLKNEDQEDLQKVKTKKPKMQQNLNVDQEDQEKLKKKTMNQQNQKEDQEDQEKLRKPKIKKRKKKQNLKLKLKKQNQKHQTHFLKSSKIQILITKMIQTALQIQNFQI